MRSSRFYQPKMATLTAKERVFVGLAEDAGLTYFLPESLGGELRDLSTRNVVDPDALPDGTKITYNFSNAIRHTTFAKIRGGMGEYGAKGLSFRMLYEFLCTTFNGGEYFIDTYFEKIFATRPVYKRLSQLNDSIARSIRKEMRELEPELRRRKSGDLDMRYATSKRYADLQVWKSSERMARTTAMAESIQNDIIGCLETGRIPLRSQTVSAETAKTRARFLAMNPRNFFFASGQLIKHLRIYVELSEE